MAALNVRRVVYGDLEFVPWYPSLGYFDPSHSPTKRYVSGLPKCILTEDGKMPYPAIETLYVCSGCFKYSIRSQDIADHAFHCKTKCTPPGRLIFKSDKHAIRRLSGTLHRVSYKDINDFLIQMIVGIPLLSPRFVFS